ncbi:transcriptional regulator [Flavobacteriaceae bacterium]|nr:transcriptional regulator [Flavobacteriaceae bacterium]MDA9294848.1 transcriptional regulator [Flavobacteriaceae bacterium]MDA9886060.1 transcriptional regulator [Flavobacteriaceae bacterium]MDB9885814.1 transcriptional regulator [Flavobacteriaceae bacterium]MDC1402366.1 transcriptional regulator [Flavobacteriaceae bacterium]
MKSLDPLLTTPLRLGAMSLLIKMKTASFVRLKEELMATQGNLSVQLNKLKEAEYISIEKRFEGNYPLTEVKITQTGVKAFEAHVQNLKKYLHLE